MKSIDHFTTLLVVIVRHRSGHRWLIIWLTQPMEGHVSKGAENNKKFSNTLLI